MVVLPFSIHPREEQTGDLLAAGVAEGPVPTGDGDVGGFALHMLGIACAFHGAVELGATVAGGNLDGQAEVLARGFETAHGKVLQRRNMALQWRVGDALLLGGLRSKHLAELEVLRQEHVRIE